MDTDIRSYNNAAESSNLLEMTFFQSRTLQQIADSKIDAEFARFTTFLREYVSERILQQRNNRHAAHRIALSSLLRKANQEPDAYEKITTDYAINSGDTLRRYIVSFKESDAMQASASSEDDLSEVSSSYYLVSRVFTQYIGNHRSKHTKHRASLTAAPS